LGLFDWSLNVEILEKLSGRLNSHSLITPGAVRLTRSKKAVGPLEDAVKVIRGMALEAALGTAVPVLTWSITCGPGVFTGGAVLVIGTGRLVVGTSATGTGGLVIGTSATGTSRLVIRTSATATGGLVIVGTGGLVVDLGPIGGDVAGGVTTVVSQNGRNQLRMGMKQSHLKKNALVGTTCVIIITAKRASPQH